jgi:predicted Zn-dependent peptidase
MTILKVYFTPLYFFVKFFFPVPSPAWNGEKCGIIQTMRKIIFVFALFTAIVFSQDISNYEKSITEFTLSNGMHFIILEDHTAPVVSFHVHVDTGSVDEKYGETGISHLIEHLAFNGTKNIGTTNWKIQKEIFEKMDSVYDEILQPGKNTPHLNPLPQGARNKRWYPLPHLSAKASAAEGVKRKTEKDKKSKELQEEFNNLNKEAARYSQTDEFSKILEKNGAVGPNAYTSNDMTAYWVELPSNKTELWAWLESDRLFNPVFSGFYEELEVVKEERRMRVDNSPWGRLMEEFHNIAYKMHPYRNPVVGYWTDLLLMTRPKVKNFYKKYYVPSNMVAVIIGDVEPKGFIPIVERYFGNVPKGEIYKSSIPAEPLHEKDERRVIVRMDSEPIFLTGYHIPDVKHPDLPALEVCAEILAGGRTSRLYRKMVKEERTALSTGAWCRTAKYPSLFYIWAVVSDGHTNREMEDSIDREVEGLKTGVIKDEEIGGARSRIKVWFLTEMESRRGMAEQLAWYQAVTGDWRNLFRYIESIDSVDAEKIKEVAKKYFGKGNRIVGMVEKE